ncbi:NAD(P)/FAD-dependent oxidoreductase [Agarilytica rhodophyticola]|uniref:NAD(P)/FAD-dependent oxidoreductase n=1 Tax=Agarilytica rhodophyticola TaxID=1737490 RepID=UPI000B3438F2|nr:FAD/NAD(P)-binding oxidoreductase [Agarilytica rhodophyticola]
MIYDTSLDNKICIIIGASHAGVNLAFYLRKEGWIGEVILLESSEIAPYHRPPLSKKYFSPDAAEEIQLLKPITAYEENNINLLLGKKVVSVNSEDRYVTLVNGTKYHYDFLVFSIGASPIVPPIKGITEHRRVYSLRNYEHAFNIKKAINNIKTKSVVVIGGGYIGLEVAASIRSLGKSVTILEKETHILKRVASAETAAFFHDLHERGGINVLTKKTVKAIEHKETLSQVLCTDGSCYDANIIILGVGVKVENDLPMQANLDFDDGIIVDNQMRTNNQNIFAIGDCTYHYNSYYNRDLRLESVQNAIEQAKTAAKAICNKTCSYNILPWFWSDQFQTKLQIVGLSKGYNNIIVRKSHSDKLRMSIWYFRDDELLAVDAINDPKAYVIATKLLKERTPINKDSLSNNSKKLHMDTVTEVIR